MSPFQVGQIQKLISDINEAAGSAVAPASDEQHSQEEAKVLAAAGSEEGDAALVKTDPSDGL